MKNLTKTVAKFYESVDQSNDPGHDKLDEYLTEADYDLYAPDQAVLEDQDFVAAVLDANGAPQGVFCKSEQYPRDNENRYEIKQLINKEDFSEKIQALAMHLGLQLVEYCEIEEEDDERYTYGREEYLVLTDGAADRHFSDSLDSYIDDCILPELPELPENLRYYFDYESFKRDVQISDGRGPSLASYDGEEHGKQVGDTWYFIYRTN
jgi:hypothetical protein